MGTSLGRFLLTPLREGRRCAVHQHFHDDIGFLLTPLREGRRRPGCPMCRRNYFYSRPCGRGDSWQALCSPARGHFYSRPCGRGDKVTPFLHVGFLDFYSRPCGRGDFAPYLEEFYGDVFLLTPLREGRLAKAALPVALIPFLLTPLREGRQAQSIRQQPVRSNFYSRPCGRGDRMQGTPQAELPDFYSRPCGRGDSNFPQVRHEVLRQIAER